MVNSRAKGKSAELELCRAIGDELGIKLKRNLTQTRSGGHDIIVVVENDISEYVDRYAIEVKRHATSTDAQIRSWWAQTLKQAEDIGKVPMLAYRANQQSWRVVIPIDEVSCDIAGEYPEYEWTVSMSILGFCGLVREAAAIEVLSRYHDRE